VAAREARLPPENRFRSSRPSKTWLDRVRLILA
jgi:hypothetical protein